MARQNEWIRNWRSISAPTVLLTPPHGPVTWCGQRSPITNWFPHQQECLLFEVLSGYPRVLFPQSPTESPVPSANASVQRLRRLWKRVRQNLTRASNQHKRQADRRRRVAVVYNPGDRVWVCTKRLLMPTGCKKQIPRVLKGVHTQLYENNRLKRSVCSKKWDIGYRIPFRQSVVFRRKFSTEVSTEVHVQS